MGKKKPSVEEHQLLVPRHPDVPADARIVDTHCHLLSTFSGFKAKYPDSETNTIQAFARRYLSEVHVIVDVWCDAPLDQALEEVASIPDDQWPFTYRFIAGIHPHDAAKYDDAVEQSLRKAWSHPKNVGVGEIGLDYHYDHSPREIQQTVLKKQLQLAIELNKPITIHTREADDDIYAVLTSVVPPHWSIHVHCFTDTVELATKLLDHFPNLYFGLTGVLTYSSNTNTSDVLRHMTTRKEEPRVVLETDSPFMTPVTIPYKELGLKNAKRMPVCHSGMITYTAQFAAEVLGEGWTTERLVRLSAANSQKHYGVS